MLFIVPLSCSVQLPSYLASYTLPYSIHIVYAMNILFYIQVMHIKDRIYLENMYPIMPKSDFLC